MTPTQRLAQEVARSVEWQVGLQTAAETYADDPVGVLLKEIARKHAAHVTRLAEIAKGLTPMTPTTDAERRGEIHAFPHLHIEGGVIELAGGLSKREEFAKAAMQGILSNDSAQPANASKDAEESFIRSLARRAIAHADELLRQLSLTQEPRT